MEQGRSECNCSAGQYIRRIYEIQVSLPHS